VQHQHQPQDQRHHDHYCQRELTCVWLKWMHIRKADTLQCVFTVYCYAGAQELHPGGCTAV
jgi:hypothetical protein